MKTKIEIDDFLTMVYWVRTFSLVEGKQFKYENLLEQGETYKLNNTPFNTKIHNIDEFMIDVCHIYLKFKMTKNQVLDFYDNINLAPFVTKDMLIETTDKFEVIFGDLMENYRYEDPEVRGIQKGFLNEKMKEYVSNEQYEKAAVVRDAIKEC